MPSSRRAGTTPASRGPVTSEADLESAVELMVAYLRLRLEMRDWYGVMDAAADLRELEAKLSVVRDNNRQ